MPLLRAILVISLVVGSSIAQSSGISALTPRDSASQLLVNAISKRLEKRVALNVILNNEYLIWRMQCGRLVETDGSPFDFTTSSLSSDWADGYVDNYYCALIESQQSAPKIRELNVGSTDAPQLDWLEKYSLPDTMLQKSAGQ